VVRVIVLGRFVDLELFEGVGRSRFGGVQRFGDRQFRRVVEFAAAESEDLQTVVVVRIVRGRHHDPDAAALLGDDRDTGRREVTEVDAARAAVAKTGQHGASQEW